MPRLPVSRDEAREARNARFARRRQWLRIAMAVLVAALAAWLAGAARAPSSGPVQDVLLITLAVLLPLHVVFFWFDGFNRLVARSGLPRGLKAALALLALGATPMVLYPLGLVAIAVAMFSGGAASPALAVTGTLMLSPIIAIGIILLMFIGSRYRGG